MGVGSEEVEELANQISGDRRDGGQAGSSKTASLSLRAAEGFCMAGHV